VVTNRPRPEAEPEAAATATTTTSRKQQRRQGIILISTMARARQCGGYRSGPTTTHLLPLRFLSVERQ